MIQVPCNVCAGWHYNQGRQPLIFIGMRAASGMPHARQRQLVTSDNQSYWVAMCLLGKVRPSNEYFKYIFLEVLGFVGPQLLYDMLYLIYSPVQMFPPAFPSMFISQIQMFDSSPHVIISFPIGLSANLKQSSYRGSSKAKGRRGH